MSTFLSHKDVFNPSLNIWRTSQKETKILKEKFSLPAQNVHLKTQSLCLGNHWEQREAEQITVFVLEMSKMQLNKIQTFLEIPQCSRHLHPQNLFYSETAVLGFHLRALSVSELHNPPSTTAQEMCFRTGREVVTWLRGIWQYFLVCGLPCFLIVAICK